ncbi:GlcG/HbpS family heme-binding protein [Devosia nitrariae]|uniref:DNA polymerase III subunit delta n=1 Tax=Devosia nitrariae TaxID=2071872 RepID=A0ABQ5W7W6_9HYPH|nr:heme-binding protein [Devosia nitrariae]GLQ56180.1 DNA polymerase III subunit delta' [Devosia nitrariae]
MKTIRELDLSDARKLLEGARALEIGVPMCIAIADSAGNLLAFERMDGGKITSIVIAIDKAFTAAAARKATHEYGEASQPGSPAYGINSAIGGRLMIVGGGLPVQVDGEVVGAVGVSSGTPLQDRAVAQAALDHFSAAG